LTADAGVDHAVTLEAMGSFYVGGRTIEVSNQEPHSMAISRDTHNYVRDPNGTYAIEHAYVAYFVPTGHSTVPLVFVHGGGLTGACWESTPDGRPGWLTAFLRAGWPCYVIDNVERGRAGWCSLPGVWDGEPVLRSQQECWTTFRIGLAEEYSRRRPFAGSQFPVDALEELTRQTVPRWTSTDQLAEHALTAVVDRIGTCVLIGHSQGGGLSARVADTRPDKVVASVVLEPAGLPATPPRRPQAFVLGDNRDKHPVTHQLSGVWDRYRDLALGAGDCLTWLDLPTMGHTGNSHLFMCDLNSHQIAAVVGDWLRTVL
jgi:pimeloyl-ACP methyl ester carboxylesterase